MQSQVQVCARIGEVRQSSGKEFAQKQQQISKQKVKNKEENVEMLSLLCSCSSLSDDYTQHI